MTIRDEGGAMVYRANGSWHTSDFSTVWYSQFISYSDPAGLEFNRSYRIMQERVNAEVT